MSDTLAPGRNHQFQTTSEQEAGLSPVELSSTDHNKATAEALEAAFAQPSYEGSRIEVEKQHDVQCAALVEEASRTLTEARKAHLASHEFNLA